MQHSLQAEGFGVRIRPVRLEDAAFIVWLRSLDTNSQLGDSVGSLADQKAWLRAYFVRPDDFYFIVETLGGVPVGTHSIYDVSGRTVEAGPLGHSSGLSLFSGLNLFSGSAAITPRVRLSGGSGEVGRSIIRTEVSAAVPASLVTFDLAFGEMGLKELRGTCLSTNDKIASHFRTLGFREVIAGQPTDFLHFATTAAEWSHNRERVFPIASYAEKQIRDWDKEQLKRAGQPRPGETDFVGPT